MIIEKKTEERKQKKRTRNKMGLFGKSKLKPRENQDASEYIPPQITVDDCNAQQDNENDAAHDIARTIEKQDSPEISEDDDGMMIITTSKSRDEESRQKVDSSSNMSRVKAITKSGRDFGEATVANVRKVAEDGPLSFRVLAFLGGAIMMTTSVLSVLSDVFTFSLLSCLISIYTFIFGLFILVLEGKMFMPSKSVSGYQQKLFSLVKCLQFVWGRGLLYIFAGTLQLSQMTFLNMVSGGYMCFIGIISLLVGHSSHNKLTQLRASIADEAVLRKKFKEHDKDSDQALNLLEFQSFITDLGLEMDHNELVAAFSVIDSRDTGKVALNEFKEWWSGFESRESADSGTLV